MTRCYRSAALRTATYELLSRAKVRIQDAARNHPDRIHVSFDDHRLVANAGLILPAILARHPGLPD